MRWFESKAEWKRCLSSNATQLTKEDVTRDDPPRHEWLEVIGGRYVSALLAALRGEGEVDRQAGWGRALTWQESRGRTAWLEEGTRVVSRTCCALSKGGVRRQDGARGQRVKVEHIVEHIAGRAAEKAPHVGPC